jgi:hypothetical protein
MIPPVDQALQVLAAQLLLQIAPRVADGYSKSSVELIGALLLEAAEECDRAAEIRVEENRDLRGVFAAAARHVPDADLARRLGDAAGEEEASLRVSALDRTNDHLRRLLVELHACVEERPETWAREVEREIWSALRRSAKRRTLAAFPF